MYDSRSTIMRPNTMNRFGVVLDDFGFESMLQKLVDDFISPLSQGLAFYFCLQILCIVGKAYIQRCAHGFGFAVLSVLFPEVSGTGLDSHHGFIVEYGKDRDTDLGKYLLGSFAIVSSLVRLVGTSKTCFLDF